MHAGSLSLSLLPFAHSLSPSPALVPASCGARCELTYLHDLPMPPNCFSRCIKDAIKMPPSQNVARHNHFASSGLRARFKQRPRLTYYIHVTSQLIKPLLTGKPLSARFHISDCEISRIRQKLQQLCMQGLTPAPDSSHLNYPLPGLPCLMNVLRSGNFS